MRSGYRKDIVSVLILKLILLFLLYEVCFTHPVPVTSDVIAHHLVR